MEAGKARGARRTCHDERPPGTQALQSRIMYFKSGFLGPDSCKDYVHLRTEIRNTITSEVTMRTILVVAAICAAMFVHCACGQDPKPPWWRAQEEGKTWALFEFRAEDTAWETPGSAAVSPTEYYNTYGDVSGGFILQGTELIHTNVPGPHGTNVPAWYFPSTNNYIGLFLPNRPEPLETKDVRVQLTSSLPPVQGTMQLIVPYTNLFMENVESVPYPGSPWVTYVYDVTASPNPSNETVIFWLPEGAYMEEFVADTWCSPEPGTMFALAFLLAMVAFSSRLR